MDYLPPFIIPGANKLSISEIEDFMIRYTQIVHFLMNEQIDINKLKELENFNQLNADQWEHQFYKMQ
jgi:glutathione-regulated potassium-efflux system ancillary protein KefG